MGYQQGIVYFIDILGTKNITNFDRKYEINSIFHNILEKNQSNNLFLSHTVYERYISVFSDCSYIVYYYKDNTPESKKKILDLFRTSLYNTSFVILEFLKHNFLCRGGVSIGEIYLEKNRNILFGPALEQAYLLETKMAKYPRIIIEEKWAEKYLEMENNNYKKMKASKVSIDPFIFEKMLEANGHIILKDSDNKYYLNYLNTIKQGIIYSEITDSKGFYEGLLEYSKKNTINYEEKFRKSSNNDEKREISNILEKYEWFNNYLNISKPPDHHIPIILMPREKIKISNNSGSDT